MVADIKGKVLITGIAGFIGFHFAKKMLDENYEVVGIDNINDYYDINLKLDRLRELHLNPDQIQDVFNRDRLGSDQNPRLTVYRTNLENREKITEIFSQEKPDYVFNSAAQAGVRYSINHPYTYIDSNIVGFINILENCRHHGIKHLVYASSSSVYGSNRQMPFSIHQNVDHPISLYAASKKSNELMAHAYSHLYHIPTTGLRFFTVYGPWGRPDMALFIFTRNILNNQPIEVYNHGKMARDFTYIDDIIQGIFKIMQKEAAPNPSWDGYHPDPATSSAPYRIFNIGNHQPVNLLYFIECIEKNLGKKAQKRLLPLQPGDVTETYADIHSLNEITGFKPSIRIEEGIKRFIAWYLSYYQ